MKKIVSEYEEATEAISGFDCLILFIVYIYEIVKMCHIYTYMCVCLN